ncbi:FMN-dependent oxidoreductase (nitrilotriacetate monooxygenase family) [Catenulispora sp. GAS73]|uniref:LLM class flavin-dependent oxidoreductase n=1 Tax=Catenulispora sp. GAS73 TaxID=3156269 RepID=UPI003516F9F6
MPARNVRPLHLNAFLHAPGHHDAAWRHPASGGDRTLDVDYHIELARTAERGLFDAVFLADSLAVRSRPDATVAAGLEPLTLLTALATATEHIGLIATASTTFYEPYILARTLASLDHISHGRAGWNVATGGDLAEAANFNLDEPVEHAVRYERAAEFLDVATQLWDSWADDAVVHDRRAGRYADPDRIREVEHTGLFFKVRGPLNVQRTPQGWPLLVHTASSADGQEFAARYAEVVLTAQQNIADATAFSHEVKARAAAYGREAHVPVILPGIAPVIGSTEAEARRLARELTELQLAEPGVSQLSDLLDVDVSGLDPDRPIPAGLLPREEDLTDHRFALITDLAIRERLTVGQIVARLSGGRGHRAVVGTPDQIADSLQEWSQAGAADGFTVAPPILPGGLTAFVDHVVPVLQRRGLFRTEYDVGTLRERFNVARPEDHFPEPAPAAVRRAARPPLARV